MRSSRLLISIRHKFTDHTTNNTSPTRMPEARYIGPRLKHATVSRMYHTLKRKSSYGCDTIVKNNPAAPSGDSLFDRVSSMNLTAASNHLRTFNKLADIPLEPGLNYLHFKKFLRLKGLDCEETHSCLRVNIPIHILNPTLNQEYRPQDITTPTVHINKKTGNFVIPSHGVFGSWQEFELIINTWIKNRRLTKDEVKLEYPDLSTVDKLVQHNSALKDQTKVYERLKPVQSLTNKEYQELLSNFNLEKRDYNIKEFGLMEARVNSELNQIYLPNRYSTGTLVGYRCIYCEEDEMIESTVPLPPKQNILPFPHGLYQASSEGNTNACVLVGSIIDYITLSPRLKNVPVISLPDCRNLHPDHIPFLDQFDTIFIWLDNDIQGFQNAKLFAQKLGEKKCRIVSSSLPSATKCVREKIPLKDALRDAKSIYHESITTFENLRESVFLEFLQAEEMMGVKWSRFDGLNTILGGFRRGEMTIFTGRTGSGKTTFLSEYSADLCAQGVNTLWCSFEVKNTRLLRTMLKQYSCVNIDQNIDVFNKIADKFSQLPLYLTDFHGSQVLTKVVDAMSHAVYVHDINHVILDNMQFMLGTQGRSFDRFAVQDEAIETFRKFATSHNCHVTLVIHPRKEDEELLTANSIFGGAKATQEADNVLLLQEEKSSDSFFKKKYIEVAKNRYAGNIGKERLRFCKAFNTFSIYAHDIYKSSHQNDSAFSNKKSFSKPLVDTEKPKKQKGRSELTEKVQQSGLEEKKNGVIFENDNEVVFGEDFDKD